MTVLYNLVFHKLSRCDCIFRSYRYCLGAGWLFDLLRPQRRRIVRQRDNQHLSGFITGIKLVVLLRLPLQRLRFNFVKVDMIGNAIFDYIHKEDWNRWQHAFRSLIERPQSPQIDICIRMRSTLTKRASKDVVKSTMGYKVGRLHHFLFCIIFRYHARNHLKCAEQKSTCLVPLLQ